MDQELRSYGAATELTGSTATVLMIKHCQLYVANLGDSRAVSCVMGLTKPLTVDHNTSNARERERVMAMGGTIKENRYDFLLSFKQNAPSFLTGYYEQKMP